MTLRNQYVEDRRPFFMFRRSHQNPEKTVVFILKDFFLRSHQNPDKTEHFHRLFWSSQNQNKTNLSRPLAHVWLSALLGIQ